MTSSGAYPVVLAVGGSDPSGGAGLQADLKTLAVTGAFATTCVTSLTVGDTRGVQKVVPVGPEDVTAQLKLILEDIPPDVVKLGLLPDRGIVEAVADALADHPDLLIVFDPVIATHRGDALLPEDAEEALLSHFLRRAHVVTPNLAEAVRLGGDGPGNRARLPVIARAVRDRGARAVLLKGGHRADDPQATDVLLTDNDEIVWLDARRLEGVSVHGAGCTLAAALTSALAQGLPLDSAARWAKEFVNGAIHAARPLGRGSRPLHHGWRLGADQLPGDPGTGE